MWTCSLRSTREPPLSRALRHLGQTLGRLAWFPGWNCDTAATECLRAPDRPVNRVSGSPGSHESAQRGQLGLWGSKGNLTSSRSQQGVQSKAGDAGKAAWVRRGVRGWLLSPRPACPHGPSAPSSTLPSRNFPALSALTTKGGIERPEKSVRVGFAKFKMME